MDLETLKEHRKMFIQMMYGSSDRQAKMLRELIKDVEDRIAKFDDK